MRFVEKLQGALGANPYRPSRSGGEVFVKLLQFSAVTLELSLLYLPIYRTRFRAERKVDLMVIGAQKAGTTWVDRELRAQGLAGLPENKECHHIDRGRLWTLRRYLGQFRNLPQDRPVIEVAPDYGPLSKFRIRALAHLMPDLRIVFIARHPAERSWSGVRMETAFDRSLPPIKVPARDHLDYLKTKRAQGYGDYAGQIARWRGAFGYDRIRVLDFDDISSSPTQVLRAILAHANCSEPVPKISSHAAFEGEAALPSGAVKATIERAARKQIEALKNCLRDDQNWQAKCDDWALRSVPSLPSGEQNVFAICGFSPNDRATSSGQKLAYKRICELAVAHKSVQVLAFQNRLDALDPQTANWPRNVTVDLVPLTLRDRIIGALRWPLAPSFVSSRRWAARRAMTGYLADPKFSVFHADFSQGLGAVPPGQFGLFHFRQHDIVSNLYQRRATQSRSWRRALFLIEMRRARRWEHNAWRSVLVAETLSSHDAAFFTSIAPDIPVKALPVSGTLLTEGTKRELVPGRIVFWGNMARLENEDAADHLVNVLLPRIRAKVPKAHVWIVGAHPTARVQSLTSQDVHVTGFIEDPCRVLASACVAAAPLRLGSGVKIKVFETLELGVPTVVSPVGGEGIPDQPGLFRAASDDAMVEALVRILQSVPAGNSATELARMGRGSVQPAEIATAD